MKRSVVLGISICAIAVALLLALWFIIWSLLPEWRLDEHEIAVLGDSLRNIGGLTAVFAASIAAWIAYRTNESRRLEAIRSNFKDRMQWAVTHLHSSDPVEKDYALRLILNLSKDSELDEADKKLVIETIEIHKEILTAEGGELEAKDKKLTVEDRILRASEASNIQEDPTPTPEKFIGESKRSVDNGE